MSGYVHGGTDSSEIRRLEKQADFTAAFTFRHFGARPGERVLDLATGVGAMGARLLDSFPGIELVGLDLSKDQLGAARANHPELPVVRGDGTRLPFRDASFERVHASWFLEHVPAPVAVLEEVRRVLKPGGLCQFIEVDNASFGTMPAFDEVEAVMRALNLAQERAGGDPFVGQRLHHLFRAAGFRRFTVEPVRLVGDARDPAFLRAMVDEFAEIFDGLDESLGPSLGPVLPRAAARLRSLLTLAGGTIRYTSRLAQGFR